MIKERYISTPINNKNIPFCSFIVAVYNREQYVSQTIQSLLAQSFPDFEIIIVNDGSTDCSDSIISKIHDSRIKYHSIDHHGCWFAKNYGIQHVKGEFCCFIDSDDFISPDFLQNAMLQVLANPDHEYYYPTALNIVKENGEKTDSIWRYVDYPALERDKLVRLFWERQIGGIPHVASLIRRNVFDKCGLYNDSFFNLSDTHYIVTHALDIDFCFSPSIQHYYNRQHNGQTNAHMNHRHHTYSEILDTIIEKYPTQYFLGVEMDKESGEFYDICIEKFITLSQSTEFGQCYAEKAAKYLRIRRGGLSARPN